MDPTTGQTTDSETQVQAVEPEIDSWEKAFAALAQKDAPADSGDVPDGETGADAPAKKSDEDEDESSDKPESGDMAVAAPGDGGHVPSTGADSTEDGQPAEEATGFSQEDSEEAIKQINESIRSQAINDIGKMFRDQNVMHNEKGQLGAYLEHPEIMKRDSNGVPTFYNPETGKPFTGDNPRAQARQWVEDYNKELVETFEQRVNERIQEYEKNAEPMLQTIRFAPKFEKLDKVRQVMVESIISDYEVHDSQGNLVGYSCNLDSVLEQVNRQISGIQSRLGSMIQPKQEEQPSSPALDMKSSATGVANGERPEFKSIAEAMEWEQDQILARQRQKESKR